MNIDIEAAGCTNTCRHCSADGHLPYGDFFTLDELRDLKQEWGPLTIRHEPTAYSNFPDVYSPGIAVENGGWLVTNGFGLARRDDHRQVFEKMLGMGIHTISFTLHGLQAHHDWFVCRSGAFDDILAATRRAKEFGFQPNWQVFVDQKGIRDVPRLVEMAAKESGIAPQLAIPYHRVGGRMQHFELIRPVLGDLVKWRIPELVEDPNRNYLVDPDTLTAAAWMEKWEQDPEADELKHPYEPRTWPPDLSQEMLTLRIQRDRKVYLDPMCAAPMFVGNLSEGKDNILERVAALEPPEHIDLGPQDVVLSKDDQERIHPSGFSLRYAAITAQKAAERAAI